MILNGIERYDFEWYWKIWFWIVFKDIILNFIKKYDFELYSKIWFWISFKDMFLNVIERYDFEWHWKIWFWILYKIRWKYLEDWYQVYHYLIKVWQFQCFLFQRPNIMLFCKLYYIRISFKYMILNSIQRYDFEFHSKIWFWISFKEFFWNFIKNYIKY